jgi:hypothetical protein
MQQNTCTSIFIVALFTIVKVCNQPRGVHQLMIGLKFGYVFLMKYYLSIKKYEIMSCAGKWMEQEIINNKLTYFKLKNKVKWVTVYGFKPVGEGGERIG